MMVYLDRLIEACNLAKNAKPQRSFILEDLDDLDGIQSAVYVVKEIGGDHDATFSTFEAYKKISDRSCSRLNAPSEVLYVGSSSTGIRKRIREHKGDGYKSTYALQLSHWAEDRNIEFRILVYDVDRDVLQLIEDALSYELKPAFGKSGGNGK